MRTNRLEAFSDGVLAVVITVMVLELDIPHQPTWQALGESAIGFLTYALSFVYVGIYWSNHHHFFQVVEHVNGGVLWANLDLLFWLSLLPFTTAWIDQSDFARIPMVVYGVNLLLAAVAWYVMQLTVFGTSSGPRLRLALGRDLKGKLSPIAYVVGIGLSFALGWLGMVVFTLVALWWLVPDRRLQRFIEVGEAR